MMVLIPISNSNEDSQGSQLRIGKKLTAVCSGKRSRFSKPRPNLAISKRGESNVSIGNSKTSKSSGKEIVQTTLDSNADINKNSGEKIVQTTLDSNANINKNSGDEIVQTTLDLNAGIKEKVIEDDAKIISSEDDIKKPVSKTAIDEVHQISSSNIEKPVSKNAAEVNSNLNIEVLDLENVVHTLPNTNTEKLSSNEDNRTVSHSDIQKHSPQEENKIIPSPEVEKSISKEDTGVTSSLLKEPDLEDVAPNFSYTNTDFSKTSEESDIQTESTKSARSPLKVSESERKNASNAAPAVIDKSKYPHLTSILSKKRTEPRKEAQQKRRKKFKKGDAPPERSKMTMADLIYWNPAKTEESHKSAVIVNETPIDNVVVEEESVDDNLNESENNVLDSVPKLVISEDGQINIDQSSLFVSRNISQPKSIEIIRKDDTTYSSFRKRPLTKHWTAKDTANFYRALSLVGADFSLMEQIFPNRTRRELKHKFKREEKFNIDIINKVLYESQTFDEITLNDFIDETNAIDDPVPVNEKEDSVKDKPKKQRIAKKEKLTESKTCDSSHLEEETENEKMENSKGKKKKTKKSSDDEDVEISVTDLASYISNADDRSGSKRKRNVKKLPDDFVSLDSIEDLEILDVYETNNSDIFEKTSLLAHQNSNDVEMENSAEEIISESASVIFDKIINGTENIDLPQNLQEENANFTVPLPLVIDGSEEYISVEYVKNDSDVGLQNVMAYEVVNTQIPSPKRRRKINAITAAKKRQLILPTEISPTNYTNYTPV